MQTDYAATSETTGVPPPPVRAARPVRRVQPTSGLVGIDVREFWSFRDLFWIFMWRDMKSRYKQTFLGPFWAVLRPVSTTILFTLVFGGLARIKPGGDLPYAIFVMPGVLIWNYFQGALMGTASSLATNGGLIAKTYFPRLYAPLSSVTAPMLDFLLTLAVTLGLLGIYRYTPSWHIIFLPIFLVLTILASLAFGLWLTGITVRYRDVPFLLPFVLSVWMYASAVVIPVSAAPEKYHWILTLNPMTSVVEGFRWCILGTPALNYGMLLIGATVSLVLLLPGLFFFRRAERTIVDNL